MKITDRKPLQMNNADIMLILWHNISCVSISLQMIRVEEDLWYLTMELCILSHVSHLPAPGFYKCALPGSDTRFCCLVAQHYTSLWDTEHQDGSPDHQPRAGLQRDSLRFSTALSKNGSNMSSSKSVCEVYWFTIKAVKHTLHLWYCDLRRNSSVAVTSLCGCDSHRQVMLMHNPLYQVACNIHSHFS